MTAPRRLLIFGHGYTSRALVRGLGAGWAVSATSRDSDTRARLADEGVAPLDPAEPAPLGVALAWADALLVCAPPGEDGCPALRALAPLWPAGRAPWIGYLSTTGVYGDRGGGWVREDTPVAPASPEGRRRVTAEDGWRDVAKAKGAQLALLRLPGIYGPSRSALDRARTGEARRWVKPGQVFSRIHVDDLADGIARALDRPQGAGIFHLCDDEPAAPADVAAFACRLLGLEPPPEEPLDVAALSPMAQRFWSESKRVSNARAKAALGWRPVYPTYREGLEALLQQSRPNCGLNSASS